MRTNDSAPVYRLAHDIQGTTAKQWDRVQKNGSGPDGLAVTIPKRGITLTVKPDDIVQLKGHLGEVFRGASGRNDSGLDGLSSKHAELLVVDDAVKGMRGETEAYPAVRLVRRSIGQVIHVHAQAFDDDGEHCAWSGNFLRPTDRGINVIEPHGLCPIHDRVESRVNQSV